jgi:hypothetical protein
VEVVVWEQIHIAVTIRCARRYSHIQTREREATSVNTCRTFEQRVVEKGPAQSKGKVKIEKSVMTNKETCRKKIRRGAQVTKKIWGVYSKLIQTLNYFTLSVDLACS